MGHPSIAVAEAAGVGVDGRDRPTEDRVTLLPHAVLLADGATSLRPGQRSGGWYAERLCAALADHLTAEPDADLRDALAAAIGALVDRYDLRPGQAPASTIAMLRWRVDRVDALVLADSPIVVVTDAGPQVLADDRIAALPAGGYRRRLRAGAGFGPDHLDAVRAAESALGDRRNAPGGFWVAEADPGAAAHARTASWPRAEVRVALLASDGVSCAVDDYGLFDWTELIALAGSAGPAEVLARVRAAENDDPDGARWPRPKRHDDQALVLVRF